MNIPTMKKSFSLLLSLAFCLAILSPMADAASRERAAKIRPALSGSAQHSIERKVERQRGDGSQSVSITGTTADGRTFERRIDTVKTDTGYTRTMTGTTPNGETINRNVSATRDAEAGTWSKDVSGTTATGKTFSTNVDGQRTETGFTTTATHTAPDGTVITRNVVATRNEDGSVSKDVTRQVTPAATPTQNDDDISESISE